MNSDGAAPLSPAADVPAPQPPPTRAAPTLPFPAPAERTTTRFTMIDALRGIAALGVACYHINRYGPMPERAAEVIPDVLEAWFLHGWTGVQMFFVISGFVIAYSLRHARVTPGYLANYAFRRSLRLDPPYWVTIGVVLLVHAVLSVHLGYLSPLDDPSPMETPLSWRLIVAHVFYVQNILGYDNLSAGLWTLCIEVQFYLLYVVGLGVAQRVPARNKRTASDAGPLGLLLVFAPLAVLSLFVWNREGLGAVWIHRVLGGDMWITHFFCMFFLGASAWWVLDGRVPAAVFWSGAALFAVRLAWDPAPDLAVALAAAVAIFVVGRAGRLGSTLNWGWIQYLGRLSYSLYLIHFPVNHVVWTIGYELSDRSPTPAAAALWMLLGLAASVAAAHALYVLVEAPSVRLSARFKRRT